MAEIPSKARNVQDFRLMKSIITNDYERCYLCGGYGTSADPLDWHHIFEGPYRNKSEKYGLKVPLHHSRCHIFGKDSAHGNSAVGNQLKAEAQQIAMNYYGWDIPEFIKLFGKNRL